MDWTTFFNDYGQSLFALGGVCIGTITSFIGLVVGYYFQKWSDERKRRWELEDRQSKKRLEIRDKKIAEAQECLNRYMKAAAKLGNMEAEALVYKDVSGFKAKSESVIEEMRLTTSTLLSMDFLSDSELKSFEQELTSLIWKEHKNTIDLYLAITNKEALDEEAIKTRLFEFSRKIGELSHSIQKKLDAFSQAVP